MTTNRKVYFGYALRKEPQGKLKPFINICQGLRGKELADDWIKGFREAISSLAMSPIRPLAPESKAFSREVKQIIYRRQSYSVAYRILYYLLTDTPDGPTVMILHVRHGSRAQIKRREAREIEGGIG